MGTVEKGEDKGSRTSAESHLWSCWQRCRKLEENCTKKCNTAPSDGGGSGSVRLWAFAEIPCLFVGSNEFTNKGYVELANSLMGTVEKGEDKESRTSAESHLWSCRHRCQKLEENCTKKCNTAPSDGGGSGSVR
ncbi:hypothetical protein L484_019968 [Morus notabilis]|uniref:Uncharacterized protein n=1 Tax=Morus notabilis TaxID=981085 RepID=W9RJN4_9ROSA|nr:hypothetical protein L484_019968 [Morus notabilis]